MQRRAEAERGTHTMAAGDVGHAGVKKKVGAGKIRCMLMLGVKSNVCMIKVI